MKLLPAVILEASKQHYKVQRLVEYCRKLDGTELQVIVLPPEIDSVPHPIGTELAVRYAGAMFNEPWLYMEADSIPLTPGFLAKITDEYYAIGKKFMLPSLEGAPLYDVASAIGVWPAQTQNYLPQDHTKPPWFDLFVYKNYPEDLHLTKQILHRYGIYDGLKVTRRYQFPLDKSVLTKEAVIFHADPTQSIIRGGLQQGYYHSGDMGDIIAALPIIKQQGGGRLIIGPAHVTQQGRNPRKGMNSYHYSSICSFLEFQPYLSSVEYRKWNDSIVDFDLSTFRFMDWNKKENLGEWQGRFIGRTELDMSSWLEVPLDTNWHGRVVVSRSPQYHNPIFPWKWVAETYGDKILFVGLPEEHAAWEKLVGRKVERADTPDIMQLSKVLAGAEIHFGNQSLPSWITMGLGKTMIMEVWPVEPNSIVLNCPKSIFAQTERDMEAIRLCTH